ncbi:STAS domain-containing protein [Mycobacterium sp.]|uniref:STAS domain-containing protein n=1 Tax=Mycobacterium sp. TaxID=1785 RepID=UPI0039C9AFEC
MTVAASEITTSVAHRDEITVLSVVGDIDVASGPLFETVVAAVLAGDPIALVIDLSNVDFLATAGLRILAATHEKMTLAGGRFAVIADSPVTRRPLELTDLDQLFSLYRTLDDAITSLSKPQGTTTR